ncbi:MAG: hypothetical protein HY901_22425 [Deltaproteobacteria bacterium]|nr:hypothetical protein [Deltaproteobacteria bacterium]
MIRFTWRGLCGSRETTTAGDGSCIQLKPRADGTHCPGGVCMAGSCCPASLAT